MADAIAWLGANWQTIVISLSGIIAGASVIVKASSPWLEKTDKDERAVAWLDKCYGWLKALSLNTPKK